jgi:hypothetical protein
MSDYEINEQRAADIKNQLNQINGEMK